ncbi:MAG TPA: VWA domain-containing protein [Bryobacteraceae bacterium]|nr:VWA domain-containing protein [Bryobacteraceae bacterium]
MRISRRGLLLGTFGSLCAQEPRFSTGVDVVTLLATVHDRDGNIVKNLSREDFVLQDNGKTQNITYFSQESDLPLTIGLLVDTSRSQRQVLEPERRASYQFLDQVLREDKDRAFLARFDTEVVVEQSLTSSRKELSDALANLQIPSRAATQIYEAVRSTSEHQMRPLNGRKAFILLSDGVSVRDGCSPSTAIEYAQRADALIFAILFAGSGHGGRGGRVIPAVNVRVGARVLGRNVMKRLAGETGGAYFEVGPARPIEQIYAEIEETLRNQYSIGYTPKTPGNSGEYRKIKLTSKKRGLIVQTRDGYYAK